MEGSDANARKPPFVMPSYPAENKALHGATYDLNHGLRLFMPDNGYKVHVRVTDLMSGEVTLNSTLPSGRAIETGGKFYQEFRIEMWDEENTADRWQVETSLEDRDVFVCMPYEGAVGDSIAWFSVLEQFRTQHKCRLHVLMPTHIQELFEKQYPEYSFETYESAEKLRPYASYYLGLFFKANTTDQPYDFRQLGLAETAAYILGIRNYRETPPRLCLDAPRKIKERYVCIASQASAHAKHWNNPQGWRLLVAALKRRGYRVLCIDRDYEVGSGDVWDRIPYGVEDFTGQRPLQERIDLIKDADFFVGLSSGLSWIAWCCKVPVVLISGICMPFGEFQTPYRIQLRNTCHGCWNDTRYEFDHHDYMWCPAHKNDERSFECTKHITAAGVLRMIDTIPGVLKEPVEEDVKDADVLVE